MTIRVLLVDDENLLREALCTTLSVQPDIEVVGEAANGLEACRMATNLRPDVVLMDVQMPILNGIEATRRIHRELPDTKVVILTTFDVDTYIFDGLQAGAIGYILKSIRREQLVQAIRSAAHGESVLHPAVATKVVAQFARLPPSLATLHAPLTEREYAILRLVAQGLTNQDVGDRLDISENTVKRHMTHILAKLGAKDRAEAVSRAKTAGLVS
jgi:DNA-binding NarL/FixJ family response regulator